MEERFDGMFMTIVNDSHGIEGFLSNFFGFMRRKTDFFSTPDKGREFVLKYFEEQNRVYQDAKRKEEKKNKEKEEQKRKEEEKKKQEDARKTAKVVELTDEEAEQLMKGEEKPKEVPVPEVRHEEKSSTEESKEESKEETKDDDDKGLIPVNNGSVTDRYVWTQTLREVTINFFIPEGVPSKNIKVNVTVTHIKITVAGQVHIEGDFYDKIKADDHVWTIDTVEKRRCVVLTFDKFEGQSWWKCALKGEAEINTKKVEPENSQLSDLDSETRPVVEKMMIDQRRKAAGMPTLEEEKNKDMLKDFMAKHPEMDFSKAKISGPGKNSFGGGGFNMN